MGLSVIIPSKNPVNLAACITAIRAAGETCRIIVVDDGLPAYNHGIGADTVLGHKPFVYSRNINLGIYAAGTDDVILLNDDALLKTDSRRCGSSRSGGRNTALLLRPATTSATRFRIWCRNWQTLTASETKTGHYALRASSFRAGSLMPLGCLMSASLITAWTTTITACASDTTG